MTQTDDFKGIYTAAGISSILAAIFIIITFVSTVVPSPEVEEEVEADERRLLRIDGNRLLFSITSGSLILTWLFLIPLFPALYLALRGFQQTYALLGAVIGEVAIITNLTGAWMFYSLLTLSKIYVAASGAERTAIVAAAQAVDALVNVSLAVGLLLIGVGLIIASLAMLRGVFSKWVGSLGVVTGILFVLAGLLGPLVSILFVVAIVPFVIWLIGVGAKLYRL